MIQYFDDEKPVNAVDVFASKGYRVAGNEYCGKYNQ